MDITTVDEKTYWRLVNAGYRRIKPTLPEGGSDSPYDREPLVDSPSQLTKSRPNVYRMLRQCSVVLLGNNKLSHCPLPAHEGPDHSGIMRRDRKGCWVYTCNGHQSDGEPHTWLLQEIFASQHYKSTTNCKSKQLLGVWMGKLAYDSKLLGKLGIEIPNRVSRLLFLDARLKNARLDQRYANSIRRVYKGFTLLLDLKHAFGVNGPTVCTTEFGAAWCKMERATFKKAFAWLLANKFIRKVGEYTPKGRNISLWTFCRGLPLRTRQRPPQGLPHRNPHSRCKG